MERVMVADETKYERLPKWAQDEFRVLRKNLEEANARAAIVAQEVESPVKIGEHFDMKGVPPRTMMQFDLGEYQRVEVVLRQGIDGPFVHVSSSGIANGLTIAPVASNVIEVRTRR